MGSVYVALQLSTNRRRALKLMAPDLAKDARSVERFQEEARVRGSVHSAHIVETIAAGIDATLGSPWLAMELLEGETLAARVQRGGPLPPAEARRVLGEIAGGLAAAHQAGIAHRDLKPENVFLATTGASSPPTVKILDFGIAKAFGMSGSAPTASVGSPAWMAPEQANAQPIGPYTDIWSFGLVAFFALTGVVYWRAPRTPDGNVTQLLQEILLEPLPPASSRAPIALPPGFDGWFARTVVREPHARFSNAGAAWGALEPLLGGNTGLAHAATVPVDSSQRPASAPWQAPPAPPAPPVPGGATANPVHMTLPSAAPSKGVPWPLFVIVSALLLGLGGAALFVAMGRSSASAESDESESADESPTRAKKKKPARTAAADAETAVPTDAAPPATPPTDPSPAQPRAPKPTATGPTPAPTETARGPASDATPAERVKFAALCAKCARNLPPGQNWKFIVTVRGPSSYAATPSDKHVVPCLVANLPSVIPAENDKVKNFVCDAHGPAPAPAPAPEAQP
jgi:serine/threonine-protein kinase